MTGAYCAFAYVGLLFPSLLALFSGDAGSPVLLGRPVLVGLAGADSSSGTAVRICSRTVGRAVDS